MQMSGRNLEESGARSEVPSRPSFPSDDGIQCFINAELALLCGCGVIFDGAAWNDCPCCCANQTACAVPVIGFRLRAG